WAWSADAIADWALLTGTGNNKQARWAAAWAIVESKEFLRSDEVELKKAHQSYESGDVKNVNDISIRIFIKRYIAFNKKVTDKQKAAMRLTVVDAVITVAGLPNAKLVPTHLSLKKQMHLATETEINYAGRKSKAKNKKIKNVCIYLLVQAANLTTLPDPNKTNYAHIGNMVRGVFTQPFTADQENMAALFTMREENTKGVFGAYIAVFRVVIS
ncbi:MAG TPA: hypothetical protein VF411_06515, partial [Bacteroidia bacterium]